MVHLEVFFLVQKECQGCQTISADVLLGCYVFLPSLSGSPAHMIRVRNGGR